MQGNSTTRTFWISGAILGLLVWLFAGAVGTAGLIGGLFLGMIAGILLARLLIWSVLEGHHAMHATEWHLGGAAYGGDVSFDRPRGLSSDAATAFAGDADHAHRVTDGNVDDLQQITGIGPKSAEALQLRGVTRFAQIADWTEDDIKGFPAMAARIRGDDWIAQAKAFVAEQGRPS